MRANLMYVAAMAATIAAVACGKDSTGPTGIAPAEGSPSARNGLAATEAPASGWAPIAPMPTPRIGLAAAALNGVIYAIGGSSAYGQIWIGGIGTTGLATVEAYDVASGTWSEKAPLPEARVYPAGATVIDGKIYVVGGTSPDAWTSTLFIYDPAAGPQGTWTTGPSLPAVSLGGASAAIDGKLYVVGGFNDNNHLWRYDPASEAWTQLPSSPWGHVFGAATAVNGKLYVPGGEGDGNILDVFDPATNQWSESSMPVGYQHHAAVAVNGVMYLVGGNMAYPSEPCCANGRTVMGFDPVAASWTPLAPTVAAGGPYSGSAGSPLSLVASAIAPLAPTMISRDLTAAAVVGDAIYLLGGGDAPTQTVLSSAEVVNPIGAGSLQFTWDFGDGGQGSGAAASHTYASEGSYSATVTATTADGLVASDGAAVTIGPALLHFAFSGFRAPVNNPDTVNTVKAGSAIPIKFSLGGDQGRQIFLANAPGSSAFACGTGPTAPIESLVAASTSGLTYDPGTDTYTYVWKTEKNWAGSCRRFTLGLADNSIHDAYFQFK